MAQPTRRNKGPGWFWTIAALFLVPWAFAAGILTGQGFFEKLGVEALSVLPGPAPAPAPAVVREKIAPPKAPGQTPASKLTFYKTLLNKWPDAATPSPTAKASKKPQTGPTFTVQVASYRSHDQANALARRLKQAGYPAYVATVRLKQRGVRYRVRVGHYAGREKAKVAAIRLKLQQRLAAYVIRENP